MRDTLYRERQLWSGNDSVEIRYVSGSSVAETSRRLRHLAFLVKYSFLFFFQLGEEKIFWGVQIVCFAPIFFFLS